MRKMYQNVHKEATANRTVYRVREQADATPTVDYGAG